MLSPHGRIIQSKQCDATNTPPIQNLPKETKSATAETLIYKDRFLRYSTRDTGILPKLSRLNGTQNPSNNNPPHTMAHSPQSTLATLHKLQKSHELSIIKLSEPVSAPLKSGSRTSNASAADTLENPSPASLEADLAHYKVHSSGFHSFSFLDLYLKNLERSELWGSGGLPP